LGETHRFAFPEVTLAVEIIHFELSSGASKEPGNDAHNGSDRQCVVV